MSSRLTTRAEADLDEIDDDVVSEFGESVAERVIERLFETSERLADNPRMGRPRPEQIVGECERRGHGRPP